MILEQTQYLLYLDGKIDDAEAKHLEWIKAQVRKVKELDIGEGEIVPGASRAYWADLMAYQPVRTAMELTVPMLILQGGRDYHVTMEDFEGWKEGLLDTDASTGYPNIGQGLLSLSGRQALWKIIS
ncbi:MAG: Esterase EstD [Chloroflexi bacterium]|nr:Esterase EstD [Chloroflexota bacterium]MBT9166052.1 Esterase EstD [Chloroflexota bacterium]